MNTAPEPGDKDPTERAHSGDAAKLHGSAIRGGDETPTDRASAHDEHRNAEPAEAEHEPEGGTVNGLHFSAPFIRRPIATFLLSFAILLAGAVAYKLLPVASLPNVEFPVISVGASLPGGDPETMASSVATPLERQFSRIAGVNQMTSTSSQGSANINLQFDLNRDINGAARDVQAAISAARAQLPANLPMNPTYRKINPSEAPVLILSLSSKTLTVPQLYDASDSILAQKLAAVPGVGQTFTAGSSKPGVRLEVNPNQLTANGLSLTQFAAAVQTINVNQPKGYLNGDKQRIAISTTDQLFGADAYRPLVIATSRGAVSNAQANNGLASSVASALPAAGSANSTATVGGAVSAQVSTQRSNIPQLTTKQLNNTAGYTSAAVSNYKVNTATTSANAPGIVRIGDVAEVIDATENTYNYGTTNGVPSVLVIVFKSPGANVIETVDSVLKQLPTLQAALPAAIHLEVALDRTQTIRASVEDITRTMIITIVLVILVVFLFLREVRSTLIPSVSVPLSIMGTFGMMYLLGYTLDNLSLMALTISTGFVVDDAIVVIENISRHLEEGKEPYEAAMIGSAEIGFTVMSMSISLIAVFIPILLMGGIVGRLFREFAVTLSVAILVSLVVSLTTTPMLSAKFLQAHSTQKHGKLYLWSERFFDWMVDEYDRGLRWVLRHQWPVLLIWLITFALNIWLFILVPKGFFPLQDTGRMGGSIQGQQDVSFEVMKQKVIDSAAVVKSDPDIQNVMASVGGGGPGGGASNRGQMFVSLKALNERKDHATVDDIINRLRPKLSRTPGLQTFLVSQQELNIGGRQSATQYQYTLTADSVTDLNKWAPQMMAAMQKIPELRDVNTDQQSNGLEAKLVIDRDTAYRLGVTALNVDQTLSAAFGQRQVSTTYKTLNQYHVVMEVAPQWQRTPEALRDIYVKTASGTQVPLSAITHFEMQRIPLQVNHQGLSPAATLSFNLAPGVSLSQATEIINNTRNAIGMPASITGGFQGSAAAFQDSLSSEPILVLLALTAVYIVLGVLYESFIHPLTILSTLPSAGVGAVLALLLTGTDMSVIAMIGIVLLIGIVKKNAIMMIDFAIVAERQHGKSPEEAIYEACLLRFRPIMMTTMAAMLGGVPLAFGTGSGSELRRPLGITIIGGLIVSQCLTLFTTPVIYLYFDRWRARVERWSARFSKKKTEDHGHLQPSPATGD
ncbi:cation/multidrug efflux pump [Terriglobus roseus DSM 18391]|uniref:Cation/multidrug efflux pump n=1 Tax=Terriglobus roseus (strain DSM 18391 / NRRL B-41598 / KBS 63) TaxID=926566 RepID=I3ZCM2_TERRK|nr:efflux RND transporter permease subunit [Terriglobus roseus]AFL86990.1 cation/multidrug efflux pump [Terriglobus roseus DSM 18391]